MMVSFGSPGHGCPGRPASADRAGPATGFADHRIRPSGGRDGLSGAMRCPYPSTPGWRHPHGSIALGFCRIWSGRGRAALAAGRSGPSGLRNTLFVLVVVWASDIGAYMVGRLVGGPKLAPMISPGKTWSGAVGGLVSAVLGSAVVANCVVAEFSAFHVIASAIVLGVISQSGDLLESGLKRHFGVKDSGRIIPGHGGLLDRLDALLAVAPVAALLALTVGRGVVLWR